MGTDQVISTLVEQIDILSNRLAQVEKESKELKTENANLKSENAELEARLNSNSRNCSRPPSGDGYKKKPALPKKANKEDRKVTKGGPCNRLSIRIK